MAKKNNNDAYQQYLEKKHASFSTRFELLDDIVQKATGSGIEKDERIVEGEVNEVHKIVTQTGREIIVRISRSKRPRFEAEQWAINHARENDVPAPEILLLERREDEGTVLTFCVQNKIEGIRMRDYIKQVGEHSDETVEIIKKAGTVLSKIHSVETKGYGSLKPDGTGNHLSWQDYMLEWSTKEEELYSSAEALEIESETAKNALHILEKNKGVFAQVKPHLLHGDYGGDHIFVDNGEISGVIDFEGCKGGDLAWDFSWWSYFGSHRPALEWLKEGYESVSSLGENFELRVNLGKLRLGLDMIWYYHHENNEAGMNHARKGINEIVKSFE